MRPQFEYQIKYRKVNPVTQVNTSLFQLPLIITTVVAVALELRQLCLWPAFIHGGPFLLGSVVFSAVGRICLVVTERVAVL